MDGGTIIMTDSTSAIGPSPLDHICPAEAEPTRKIMAAREASELAITEARVLAAFLRKQRPKAGTRDGQTATNRSNRISRRSAPIILDSNWSRVLWNGNEK
jgi:hypothetical protein